MHAEGVLCDGRYDVGHTNTNVLLCDDDLLSSARRLLTSCAGNNMLAPIPCVGPVEGQTVNPEEVAQEPLLQRNRFVERRWPVQASARAFLSPNYVALEMSKVVEPRGQTEKWIGIREGPLGAKGVNCEQRIEQ